MRPQKILLIGDSGKGKTVACAKAAEHPWLRRLIFADLDDGLDPIYDKKLISSAALAKIEPHTFKDKLSGFRGASAGFPDAAQRFLQLCDTVIPQLTIDDLFVLDSFTMFGAALLRYVQGLGGKLGSQPSIPQYGAAMDAMEKWLEGMSTAPCNIVVTAHITYVGDQEGQTVGYPTALGSKLPPKMPRYYNSVLMCDVIGAGQVGKRIMRTEATPRIGLKNPAPSFVPPEMEPDIGKYIELVRKAQSETEQPPVPTTPAPAAFAAFKR